jgi:hypothetical protein
VSEDDGFVWVGLVGMFAAVLALLAIVMLILTVLPARAGEAFDWDRYHDRQDACRELSGAQRACATYGLTACDQAVLDRLQRQCSAFGSLGQRPRCVSAVKW